MRSFSILVVTSIGLAFFAGYLSLSVFRAPHSTEAAIAAIATLRQEFQRTHKPEAFIDFGKLFSSPDTASLVDPKASLASLRKYPLEELQRLDTYARSCDVKNESSAKSPSLRKAWLWHQYLCGATRSLPSNFFESPPFLHPSGASYAYLALMADKPTDARFAHLLELSTFSTTAQTLTEPMIHLAGLDMSSLGALWNSESTVISQRHVYIRQKETRNQVELATYAVYSREEWDRALHSKALSASYTSASATCFFRDGSLCWQYSLDPLFGSVDRFVLSILLALILVIAGALWFVIQRIRQQRKNEEEKRFALQTLTHELRTPLTSLNLSIESLRNRFDSWSEGEQISFLRVCDDVQRIRRLMEGSRRFLVSHAEKTQTYELERIESFNTYLEHVVEPFEDRISVHTLEEDCAIRTDPYWLGICIKNLIENALTHGRNPVHVSALVTASHLSITVEDAGKCEAASLKEMTKAFSKGPASQGVGLGLSIVDKVIQNLGGTLIFASRPTRFSLQLRRDT